MSNRQAHLQHLARTEHERFRRAEAESIDAYLACGRALIEAKDSAAHGEWLPWLEGAGIPERTARNMMAIARAGMKSETVSDLGGIKRALVALRKATRPDPGDPPPLPSGGRYSVLVLDPPWPMEMIARDVRPAQTAMPYPTMTEAELAALELPAADHCHVWTWTTHKFLPMALRLFGAWGVNYVCPFVWHKPGGFQPFGLPQYNHETALYGRIGSPAFRDTSAFPTCFNAPRGEHSAKPERFYEMVRRATDGPRLDMFNRRRIDGFDGWGIEAPAEAA